MTKIYYLYFLPLARTFAKLMMVSILLSSREKDIPVFKYKLRMIPMRIIRNSNILDKLKSKSNNPYVDWTVTL